MSHDPLPNGLFFRARVCLLCLLVFEVLRADAATISQSIQLTITGAGAAGCNNPAALYSTSAACTTPFLWGNFPSKAVGVYTLGPFTMVVGNATKITVSAGGPCGLISTACISVPATAGTMYFNLDYGGGVDQVQTGPPPDKYIRISVQNKTISVKTWNVKNAAGAIVGVITVPPGGTVPFTYHSATGAVPLTLEGQMPDGTIVSSNIAPTDSQWESASTPTTQVAVIDSLGVVGNINGDGTISFSTPIGTGADNQTLKDVGNAITTTLQQGDAVQSGKLSAIQLGVNSVNTVLGTIAGQGVAEAANLSAIAAATAATQANTAGIGGKLDGIGTGITAVKNAIDGLTFPAGVDPRPNIDAIPANTKATGEAALTAAGPFNSSAASTSATSSTDLARTAITDFAPEFPTPSDPGLGSWVISFGGHTMNLNPLANPAIAPIANLVWKVILWLASVFYLFTAWGMISRCMHDASQVPQARTAGTTILGNNANSLGALAMAAIIVALIAAIPVGAIIAFGSGPDIVGFLGLDPLTGFSGGVQMGIGLAFKFVPISELLVYASSYFVLWLTCDSLYLLTASIIKFSVGV